MVKINLLPWREDRRLQLTKEFYMMIGAGALLSLLLVGIAWYYYDSSIEFQKTRNIYLTDEISKLDEKILEIKELENKKANLIAKQQVIEELQANRTQMVHLFDELVKSIPNGVFLETIKQQGSNLSLEGYSQSHSRVSDYMRKLNASAWFTKVELVYIKVDNSLESHEQKFKLSAKLINPNRIKDNVDSVDNEGAEV